MSSTPKFWNYKQRDADIAACVASDLATMNAATTVARVQAVNATITLGTGTNVGYVVVPVAGTVTKIYSVIDRALTTGDETLSFAVTGGTTMGDIVITETSSAAGDVDSLTPTANLDVVAGDTIDITTDGANGTAVIAQVTVYVTI